MTNFVGNRDPKIQACVFANGGCLLSVAGGREISEAQQIAIRQVVRADVVSEKISLDSLRLKKSKKKKWGGREEGKGSPGDKDTYVEMIRVIRVLGVQLVGPRGETGQCIFGVGTNGQIYLRENHFEMDRNHFVVAGVRTNLCFEIFNSFASW